MEYQQKENIVSGNDFLPGIMAFILQKRMLQGIENVN